MYTYNGRSLEKSGKLSERKGRKATDLNLFYETDKIAGFPGLNNKKPALKNKVGLFFILKKEKYMDFKTKINPTHRTIKIEASCLCHKMLPTQH